MDKGRAKAGVPDCSADCTAWASPASGRDGKRSALPFCEHWELIFGFLPQGTSVRDLPSASFVVGGTKRDAPEADMFSESADRRITKNPTVSVQPVFKHADTAQGKGAGAAAAAKAAVAAAAAARAARGGASGSGLSGSGAAAPKHGRAPAPNQAATGRSRVQDGDPFSVLLPDDPFNLAEAALIAGEGEDGPFEICPQLPDGCACAADLTSNPKPGSHVQLTHKTRIVTPAVLTAPPRPLPRRLRGRVAAPVPRALAPVRPRQPRAQVLIDGMVLIRNYLSLEAQADIVRAVARLGAGVGGFITPGYRRATRSPHREWRVGEWLTGERGKNGSSDRRAEGRLITSRASPAVFSSLPSPPVQRRRDAFAEDDVPGKALGASGPRARAQEP